MVTNKIDKYLVKAGDTWNKGPMLRIVLVDSR